MKRVRARMLDASASLNFERAAELRDALVRLEKLEEPTVVVQVEGGDRDVIGYARDGDDALVSALARLEHSPSRARLEAERALVSALGASCRTPVGVHAETGQETIASTMLSAPGAGGLGGPPAAPSSLRSTPAENAEPAPVSTMAPTSGSSPSVLIASLAATRRATDSALRASGRLSLTTATPSAGRSMTMSSVSLTILA